MVDVASERVEIELEVDGEALLVVGDQAHPGWRFAVGERGGAPLTVDGILRAVPVRAGDRRVVLAYRPASLRLGLVFALVAALGLVAGFRRGG